MSRRLQLETVYRATIEEIANFCKARSIKIPNVVAVSKYKPAEDIEVLYQLGHRHFGENYVQELQEKANKLPKDIKWHFIGNLQSNKAKIAREIPNLAFVETLDSISKATKLDNQRGQLEKPNPLGVYIQVNTSNEAQKAGILSQNLSEIRELAQHVLHKCENLRLVGLMTIGSFEQSMGSSKNKNFSTLVEIRNKLAGDLKLDLELSMGMSSDYIQAISQGSTNVRIGTKLFGARATKDEVKNA